MVSKKMFILYLSLSLFLTIYSEAPPGATNNDRIETTQNIGTQATKETTIPVQEVNTEAPVNDASPIHEKVEETIPSQETKTQKDNSIQETDAQEAEVVPSTIREHPETVKNEEIFMEETHQEEKIPDISPSVVEEQPESTQQEDIIVEEHHQKEEIPDVSPSVDSEADEERTTEQDSHNKKDSSSDKTAEEENEYKTGSVCSYCKYCKLCKLCDKKCPCNSNENYCDMCKYCKYCYLCGSVCDTICTPGSFLDMFSSAVYEVLPTFSEKTKKDAAEDIEKAKDFIKEYL